MAWMHVTMFYSAIVVAFAAIGLCQGHLSRQNTYVPDLYATCTVVEGRDFPSLVSLEADNVHVCTGSILNSEWILTAKTCSLWARSHTIVVREGNNILKEGFPHNVTKIKRHPSTKCGLSLLKVTPPIKMNEGVLAATLPEIGIETLRGMGTIAGWGSGPYWKPLSENLKKMDLRIIDTNLCNETFFKDGRKIFHSEFCAEYIQRSSPCTGDIGGPLYVDGVLLGVTEGRYRSLRYYSPEVFIKVSYFMDWIETIIG